jgi:hypothetical protein
MRQQRPQILEVEQQQALVVGDLEGDVEHALLGVVEVEEARQQQRPHLGDGGADGWPCSPNRSQKIDREFGRLPVIGEADRLGALDEEVLGLAHPRRCRTGRP